MKKETLKSLIEKECERVNTISEFKKVVFDLIDLYEQDKELPQIPNREVNIPCDSGEMVPYYEICSCNPKNGGSGICGCIMANQLVPKNPTKTYFRSSTTTFKL